ncbi:hypothetical protein V492_03338 [Pseudogymnoascus sp. VKM F-4246]|nr:hypothetical protein V492_03338 [Pseudogymnoascus sp. VKM F-4246]
MRGGVKPPPNGESYARHCEVAGTTCPRTEAFHGRISRSIPALRPDPSSCVPREWSQASPVSAPSHFIPVYTADDDELAGALEPLDQEANPETHPAANMAGEPFSSTLGSNHCQNIASLLHTPVSDRATH